MSTLAYRGALCAFATFCIFAGVLPRHVVGSPSASPVLGVVTDTAGTPLPNARVVIPQLGRSTTTAADGSFSFSALRPGSYHADVSLIGYAPGHAEFTVPAAGPPVRLAIALVPTPLALAAVEVTASATAEDPLRVARSTVQLSGKELGRELAPSVAQTLAEQPGISVRYAGPAAAAPVIRGLTGERVLVLQDGQRSGDLSSTSPDHGVTIDPLGATQIEVVRGPASLLYGSSALGGVVNVISHDIPTSIPSHAEGYVATQAETVNPGAAASGSLTLPLGPSLALTVRGGGRASDDVRVGGGDELDNSEFRNLHGLAALGFVRERVSAGLAYRGYGFNYGLPAAPRADAESGVHLEGLRHDVIGRTDVTLGERGLSYLRLDGTAQWYTHDEIEPSGEVGTTFNLRTQTASVSGRTLWGRLSGSVGASALLKQYAPEGEEALTPSAGSNSYGAFLFQEIALGSSARGEERQPHLEFGARYDIYRIDADAGEERFGPARSVDFDAFSGSVGINVPFSSKLSGSVSVARAFRVPTVEELFSNGFHVAAGSFDIGNPNLGPETNQGIDGVLRVQSAGITALVSAYYNRIGDYIAPSFLGDTVVAEDGETFQVPLVRFRQADATLRGLEGQVETTVGRNWVLGAMGDLVRGSFENGSALPFMPAARVGASARWDTPRYFAGLQARHAFEQDRVPLDALGEPTERATEGYTLVDLSAGATLIRGGLVHSITLRVDNLFDELYRDATSRIKDFAPNPGRNLALVYRVLF